MKKKSRRLSGAMKVTEWAKGRCFRDFRGRAPLIETCLRAVKETTDLVVSGKAMYFSDAVDVNAKNCLKIKNLNEQTACLVGTTEVLLKSKGQTASLEGLKVHPEKWGVEVEATSYNELARWMNQNRKKIGKAKSVVADFVFTLSGKWGR